MRTQSRALSRARQEGFRGKGREGTCFSWGGSKHVSLLSSRAQTPLPLASTQPSLWPLPLLPWGPLAPPSTAVKVSFLSSGGQRRTWK